ncbi:MAG: recombinase zinc beta ribbon domain-containing protein [Anaerolineales bacterium]|nr:recombinase zinc beta ribbon domain-containing protein [Anaerolineales bacterium]
MRAEGKSYSEITRATGGKIYKSINCWPTFFNNKTYLGIGKCGDLEVSDHHEAAITQKKWDEVQSLIEASPWYGKKGHPNHPRRKGNPSLLSGMAVCASCGAAIIHHTGHKDHQWPYYVCGDKDRKKGFNDCKARRVGAKKAEEAILDTVLNRVLTPTYFEELMAELRSRMENSESLEAEISEKQIALRDIDRGIQNLLDLAESFGAGAALGRLKQREVERVGVVAELNQLEAKKDISKVEISSEALSLALDTWRNQVLERLEKGEIPAMKIVLRRFVSKIELGYKQARIEYTYPLDTTTPFVVYSGGGTKKNCSCKQFFLLFIPALSHGIINQHHSFHVYYMNGGIHPIIYNQHI